MRQSWIRRRWYDFRNGHSFYLIFLLSFSNFILISHRLLIERVTFLDQVFANLWFFVIAFISIYVPVAILIGHWHKKTQLRVEQEMAFRENILAAQSLRLILELLTGKASEEEVENLRNLLKRVEQGKGLETKK